MLSPWWAVAIGLDAATAACAALNFGYFTYSLGRQETPPRAVAAFALALVSLALMGESLFFLASRAGLHDTASVLPWALVRGLALAGAGLVSLLVLRRLYIDLWPEGDRQ